MLLVFTPCLYCNVSDSWMLPNKWHRAAIGAAGMYVELFLASFATFIWWYSQPGLFNHLRLSVMFICSVSTVMFNGNPLLRFDGYYILMDMLEIPNLRQKSTEITKRFLLQRAWGSSSRKTRSCRTSTIGVRPVHVAAVIYRWVVVFSIVFFLNKVFEPYGLKVMGQAIALAGVFGLVVQPLWQLFRFFYLPGRMHKVKKHRVAATLAVATVVVVAVLAIPLPFHVDCTFEISPLGAQSVFPGVKGKLSEVVSHPGDTVAAGQVLARLDNIDLLLKVTQLEGERDRLVVQERNLHRQAFVNSQAAMQIPAVKKMLETVEEQLREESEQIGRLEIIAPVSGTLFPPP